MKTGNLKTLILKTRIIRLLVTLLAIAFTSACSDPQGGGHDASAGVAVSPSAVSTSNTYGDEGIGFRKETLFNEQGVEPPVATFTTVAPGSSQNLERAFSTAPPQIPHSVEGLLPIKTDSNSCIACHLPAVAAALKATSVPDSHMRDGGLSNARFSCSQCHVPQANVELVVDNDF
jgi:cytochrome c-type protein NapB